MGHRQALPLPVGYTDEELYINDLIDFVSSSELLQLLCGGVHILDFFTREPDLYECLLPEEWREFFELHDLDDLLDLFLRDDVESFRSGTSWRGQRLPPESLSSYISKIRSLALRRGFDSGLADASCQNPKKTQPIGRIPRHIAVGMKEKKIHEVDNFTRFVDRLVEDVENRTGRKITHLVDFGSGQNYLGRTLASPPYNKHVIAVESRHANVEGAKAMDVHAKLATKEVVWRNKKEWRAQLAIQNDKSKSEASSTGENEVNGQRTSTAPLYHQDENHLAVKSLTSNDTPRAIFSQANAEDGSIRYIERRLEDGELASVIKEAMEDEEGAKNHHPPPNLMVISLHSCGNLTHHGLRSLVLNPSVSAVALVGCCYNLVTERLTAPTYKLPNLRPPDNPSTTYEQPPSSDPSASPQTPSTPSAKGDPHGFPMSTQIQATTLTLNITARMMAVQAPYNWTSSDSARFFTRHFYRALLQKIFLDKGVVEPPSSADAPRMQHTDRAGLLAEISRGETSNVARIPGGATQPVIIGSLRKACYASFPAYVRGAVTKLSSASSSYSSDDAAGASIAALVRERLAPECVSEEEMRGYEARFARRRKHLSVVWSLMAFSATLVEALIVVDRWLWLREQAGNEAGDAAQGRDAEGGTGDQRRVKWAWVQSVFEYSWSPRNLAIIGIKE